VPHTLTDAGFAYDPAFSPDGKHVLFSDRANRLAFVTLAGGKVTVVAEMEGSLGVIRPSAAWSPDGKWIAYESRDAGTLYDRIALYELASGKSRVVTDGFASAGNPAFSRDGKHLFFSASVDSGPQRFGLDLSASTARDATAGLYLAVLAKDGRNPFFPKSDEGAVKKGERKKRDGDEDGDKEEKGEKTDEGMDPKDEKADEKREPGPKPLPKMTVDLDGLDQRILALPLPEKDYGRLACSKDRLLFQEPLDDGGPLLKSFDLDKKKAEEIARGVQWFEVSADGLSVLTRGQDGWNVMSAQG
jgi:tricorn protease